MTDVQFEENQQNSFTSRQILGAPVMPTMAKKLIKIGIVKTDKQAEYLMFAIIIICIVFILYINIPSSYYNFFGKKNVLYQEDIPKDIRDRSTGEELQEINSLPHRNY